MYRIGLLIIIKHVFVLLAVIVVAGLIVATIKEVVKRG